jgi:hypothetical protein
MDITTATPAEIDTVLAEIWERRETARFRGLAAAKHAESHRDGIAKYEAGDLRYSAYSQSTLDRLEAEIAECQRLVAECDVEAEPYEAEYHRRGRWTRAWKVTNSNGHIHRSMHCSTCYPTTSFGWLPQVSGLDEAEIVDLAGEGACTICYPSAPAVGPNRLYTPTEQAEREARAAEKAAKAAAKAAKSLSLDGSVVEVRWTYTWLDKDRRGWKDIKTYRAAELFVVEALSRPGVVDSDVPPVEVLDEVLDMMAAKKGLPVEEIRKPLQAKADKKRAQRVW